MKTEATFTEIVELHERRWGTKHYPGRPSLKQLLDSTIVAVWKTDKQFRLSVHSEASQVNNIVHGLVTGRIIDPLNRKLIRIFVNQEALDFRIKVTEAPKAQEQISASGDPRTVPLARQPEVVPLSRQPEMVRISDNRRPTIISSRPEPQVVAVLPAPTPAFINPDPKPIRREFPKPLHYGDMAITDKPAIISPMPEHRNIYVEPRRNPQFSKGLDKRLRDEINKRIK